MFTAMQIDLLIQFAYICPKLLENTSEHGDAVKQAIVTAAFLLTVFGEFLCVLSHLFRVVFRVASVGKVDRHFCKVWSGVLEVLQHQILFFGDVGVLLFGEKVVDQLDFCGIQKADTVTAFFEVVIGHQQESRRVDQTTQHSSAIFFRRFNHFSLALPATPVGKQVENNRF